MGERFMSKILIIGYGIVGQNIHKIFTDADIYDPDKCEGVLKNITYDFAFICVPTPKKENGECDYSIVEEVIKKHKVKIFIIKSTIPPGTTELLGSKFLKKCVFSPEYYGETVHANDNNYEFVILGGNKINTRKVAELYKNYYTGRLKIFQTDTKTAELCKYMENAFLATKVIFCNEFYRIAERYGIDYNELRELWLADPRINRSHSFVYEKHPYYESKCLDKDLPAILEASKQKNYEPKLLKYVIEINKKFKKDFHDN